MTDMCISCQVLFPHAGPRVDHKVLRAKFLVDLLGQMSDSMKIKISNLLISNLESVRSLPRFAQ